MSKPIEDSQLRDYKIVCIIDGEKQIIIGQKDSETLTSPNCKVLSISKIERKMK